MQFTALYTAGKLLENMDASVDPCDNFFEFACGGWRKRTVIPEDRPYHNVILGLMKEVEVVLKGKHCDFNVSRNQMI